MPGRPSRQGKSPVGEGERFFMAPSRSRQTPPSTMRRVVPSGALRGSSRTLHGCGGPRRKTSTEELKKSKRRLRPSQDDQVQGDQDRSRDSQAMDQHLVPLDGRKEGHRAYTPSWGNDGGVVLWDGDIVYSVTSSKSPWKSKAGELRTYLWITPGSWGELQQEYHRNF